MDEGQRRGHLRHPGQPVRATWLGPLHAEELDAASAVTGYRQHAAWSFDDLRGSRCRLHRLYFFVYDWPANGQLVIPGLANKPVRAFLLDGRQPAPVQRRRTTPSCITVPAAAPDKTASVVALDIQGAPRIIKPDPYADETPAQRDARMNWWRESRFGMFIHWGVYSVPAGTYKGKRITGHRRVDHEPRQDPRRGIPRLRQGIQPGEVQRRRVGAHRQGRRHEIHRHHLQAPRRLCHVRLEGVRLEHRQGHALWPRPVEGTGRRLPEIRPQARLLLFAGAGLEQRRRRRRRQVGPGPGARAWTTTSTRSPCRR